MEKKNAKKEIVKMLLNKNLDVDDEEQLLDMLIDEPISIDVDKREKQNETFGDRVADKITKIAGSWTFIIIFVVFLLTWIILNLYLSIILIHIHLFC